MSNPITKQVFKLAIGLVISTSTLLLSTSRRLLSSNMRSHGVLRDTNKLKG